MPCHSGLRQIDCVATCPDTTLYHCGTGCCTDSAGGLSRMDTPQRSGARRCTMRHASVVRREQGFTLLELIVVLVILGLMLSLVLVQGPVRSPTVEFDSVVRQVTGALRLARSRAIADDRLVAVQFAPRGYRLDQETPIVFSPGISLSGSPLIDFTPDGGSSGGEITLRMGRRQMVIGVDWLTGQVKLSERG